MKLNESESKTERELNWGERILYSAQTETENNTVYLTVIVM